MSNHVKSAKYWLDKAPVEYRNGNAKRAGLSGKQLKDAIGE